jgi:LPXTG-site transpeptidase (sortase) family protein
MTGRRIALVLAALSLVLGAVAAFALVNHRSDAPHIRALGSLTPATTRPVTAPSTTAPVSTTPSAPQYPTATTVPPARPVTGVSLPAIGVEAPVVPVGVQPGTNDVEIPDIDHVGWYQLGPSPGQEGSAVLVGHVDGEGRPGVFFDLGKLVPGDVVTVDFADGGHLDFRVVGIQQVAKAALPADLFSRDGDPRLTLITCGGAFDSSTGHYVDNVVVVAVPVA